MGLAIAIGMLAELKKDGDEHADSFRAELLAVNACLASVGAPVHAEPERIDKLDNRSGIRGFPYSYLHFLRYAYAHRIADSAWIATPLPDDTDPASDPALEAQLDPLESHLICHSDAEGLYVPVEFDYPAFHDELPGGILGSSYRLLEELIVVAPAIGVELVNKALTDREAARINELVSCKHGLYRELCAWLALYEAARLSIEHKTAIVFC
ncbi:hypothetical protein IV454_08340 [Massilia antarctica]|uniref:Uncharacterized protein n=1 Tax=Massilia antarctica TaxID=2765360 RepID=A0AA48WGU5_9BURK|nr:hypothetical protein [Massilia antarctica]QPI51508.1 hypothetical protein IV454_08340 [Massilia antarctica]